MAHFTQGQNGITLVEKKQYEEGIELLSKAIRQVKSPAWLLARAQAYQQIKQLDKALDDAELAYITASERTQTQSRDQMIMAQYRRAVILFKLKRYADADACCVWSMQLAEGKNFRREEDTVCKNVDETGDYKATLEEAKAATPPGRPSQGGIEERNPMSAAWARSYAWRSQVLGAMEKLPKGDPGRKLTVPRVPLTPTGKADIKKDVKAEKAHENEIEAAQLAKDKKKTEEEAAAKNARLKTVAQGQPRMDFYQSDKKVNLTMYIKNTNKDALVVHFERRLIHLSGMPVHNNSTNTTIILAGDIQNGNPTTVNVTPSKIELTMDKAVPGQRWGSWGLYQQPDETSNGKPQAQEETPARLALKTKSPDTSESPWTDTPPKDKDAPSNGQDSDVTPSKKESQATETPSANATNIKAAAAKTTASKPPAYPTSSKSGPKDWDHLEDAEEDDDKGDVNFFFKQLYKSSTPEQQRAMLKSFTESNGTALSTDWNDVGARKVETHPPDGVEAKKW